MKPFEYIPCRTLQEACAALTQYGPDARILAGGTDLLIELRRAEAAESGAIVDISWVGGLRGIHQNGSEIFIKPLTTHTEISRSAALATAAPFLSAAASSIGSHQIRNRGTVGGNIMNAATCADTVPPLVALDARVTLHSTRGTRELPLYQLFLKPYTTCAQPDEVLSQIRFTPLPANARSAFVKLGRRNAVSIARLSVAAALATDASGAIRAARIVAGSAFPTWNRLEKVEKMLLGQKPSPRLFSEAGREASQAMLSATGRRWSTEYKEPVLAVLIRRALERCCQ